MTEKINALPLSKDKIYSLTKVKNAEIYTLSEIDSTNDEARRLAFAGVPTPTLVVANSQTLGRGRMGRSFFSPADTGIYLSYLQKAKEDAADTVRLTTAAAVATAEAIDEVCGVKTEIKWVNDLLIDGKKVAGILCESFSLTSGERYVIIGIGINISTSDFPSDIKDRAASLGADPKKRECLAAAILDRLEEFYKSPSDERIIKIYKERSAVLGKRVLLTDSQNTTTALATDIRNDGALMVTLDSGEVKALSSGEITLRFDNGKEI